MNKIDQYNSIESYYGNKFHNVLEFFMKNEGCYILSDDSGIALLYRCSPEDPDTVDYNGKSLYIQYLAGDITKMIRWCSPDVEYLIWDRKGQFKIYEVNKLQKVIKKFTK